MRRVKRRATSCACKGRSVSVCETRRRTMARPRDRLSFLVTIDFVVVAWTECEGDGCTVSCSRASARFLARQVKQSRERDFLGVCVECMCVTHARWQLVARRLTGAHIPAHHHVWAGDVRARTPASTKPRWPRHKGSAECVCVSEAASEGGHVSGQEDESEEWQDWQPRQGQGCSVAVAEGFIAGNPLGARMQGEQRGQMLGWRRREH